MRLLGGVLLLLLTGGAAAAELPAPGPAASIGAAAHGCLQGAAALPQIGPSWQVLRPAQNRFWGMPVLVSVIEEQAARIAPFGQLLIGDMSLPRGGRMPSGHASHQTGLDADILFRLADHRLSEEERDNPDFTGVVEEGRILPDLWGPAQRAMLKNFAEDLRVDRIFVNPAIKRHLCRTEKTDRAWLHRLRPWWGHNAHFHIRLACQTGDTACESSPPIPEGEGCGADLDWWFTPEASAPAPAAPRPSGLPPRFTPLTPAACKGILPGE
jgi:penicillin-insensitive murein endopeptidase